jgi:hypothetical protein
LYISEDEYKDLKKWKKVATEQLLPALEDAAAWKKRAIEELLPALDAKPDPGIPVGELEGLVAKYKDK